SGNNDGIPELPDGEFLAPFGMTCVADYFKEQLKQNYKNRHVISSRMAHLSDPQPIHLAQGRAKCLNRDVCQRGCPFGGYFSSNSSTLPAAEKTGNLSLLPDAIVESILYDESKEKAIGVRVIDAHTKEATEYYARVIFANASAFNTNLLLLNSISSRFPNGL